MKIKIYVIDMEIPHAVKRTLIRAGGPFVLLLAFGSVVNAAPPHTFVANETLTAANLMQDFTDLDTRVSSLEKQKVVTFTNTCPSGGATACACSTSSCTFNSSPSGSVTNMHYDAASTGIYTVSFAAGTFSTAPTCVLSGDNYNGYGCSAGPGAASAASVPVSCNHGQGAAPSPFTGVCIGQ